MKLSAAPELQETAITKAALLQWKATSRNYGRMTTGLKSLFGSVLLLSERGNRMKENLIRQIENYPPFNEQEEKDKALILGWIRNNENAFSRENTVAHITASAWVVNKDRSKVLMVYHNIYNSWSWLGGHADGETDLLSVAIREVKEEAGISNVRPVSEEIFSLESLTVDGHVKKGNYVSSHLHLNITYLLEADSGEQVSVKADENSGVMWFSPEDALEKSTEPWFVEHIYSKLIKKMGV